MTEKILLVDDDANVLDGYRRSLSRTFHVDTVASAQEALKAATESGPYAVVVSDLRMPGMDGIQLMVAIKARWPDTIRVICTGNADTDTAVDAINEGSIFRFLYKPCTKETMIRVLAAALEQYELVMMEKRLLEQTLSGAIQVLTDVLSLVNPAAFGRAERARRYIRHVVTSLKLGNPWQYEVAAMMCQLGCVTLPSATVDAVYKGEKLSANEQAQYEAHPHIAYDLISKIPRLEPIALMIDYQNKPMPVPPPGNPQQDDVRRGAELLRLILAYEQLIHKGSSRTEAAHTLSRQKPSFDAEFLQALVTLDPNSEEGEIRRCQVKDLAPGMIIQQEVRGVDGTLVVSKGQEVTAPLLLKLKNLLARGVIGADLAISMPATSLSFAGSTV